VFESFWTIYPRKIARKYAQDAWKKIPAYKHLDVLNALKNHVTSWKQKGTEKQFIPYPATWLNGARWEDEIELAPEMPQCDWNRNGSRDVAAGRCEAQAVKEHEKNFYCGPHCLRLGLKFLKAA
jgi:hypothetical protein